jgi:hypothetical protein
MLDNYTPFEKVVDIMSRKYNIGESYLAKKALTG